MKRGDLVRWAIPEDASEAREVYKVLEVRGESVLVEDATGLFDDWTFRPVMEYRTADLLTA